MTESPSTFHLLSLSLPKNKVILDRFEDLKFYNTALKSRKCKELTLHETIFRINLQLLKLQQDYYM